jgi:hypothetical protein
LIEDGPGACINGGDLVFCVVVIPEEFRALETGKVFGFGEEDHKARYKNRE